MPKAAVDEYNNPLFSPSKVGSARHRQMSAPPTYPVLAQHAYEHKFGLLVAFAADTRHYVRPLLLRKDVHVDYDPSEFAFDDSPRGSELEYGSFSL